MLEPILSGLGVREGEHNALADGQLHVLGTKRSFSDSHQRTPIQIPSETDIQFLPGGCGTKTLSTKQTHHADPGRLEFRFETPTTKL